MKASLDSVIQCGIEQDQLLRALCEGTDEFCFEAADRAIIVGRWPTCSLFEVPSSLLSQGDVWHEIEASVS